jgi:MFS family permease
MTADSNVEKAPWRALVARERIVSTALLTLTTALFAFNEFLVSAAMPSAADEFATPWLLPWAFVVFLVFSISGGVAAANLKKQLGARKALVLANSVFIVGTLLAIFSEGPLALLVGRVMQGGSEGVAFAIAYALIPELYPGALVAKVFGLEAIVWALAGFGAPVAAGALTQFLSWRAAFAASFPMAVPLVVLAFFLAGKAKEDGEPTGTPWLQLLIIATAILLLSSASFAETGFAILIVLVAIALLSMFVIVDSKSRARVLPVHAFSRFRMPGPGLWVVLLMPVAGAAGSIYFIFGLREIAGLAPLPASLVQSLLAISWSLLAVWVSNFDERQRESMIRLGAPLLVAGYLLLCCAFLIKSVVAAGFAQVVIGAAFGFVWGPLGQMLMERAETGERDRTSALLPTLQSAGYAIGGAVFGAVAHLAGIREGAGAEAIRSALVYVFAAGAVTAMAAVYFTWRMASAIRSQVK